MHACVTTIMCRDGAALQSSNVQLGVLVRRGVGGTCPLRAAARRLYTDGVLSALLDERPVEIPVSAAQDTVHDAAGNAAQGAAANDAPMDVGAEDLNEGGVVEGLDELVMQSVDGQPHQQGIPDTRQRACGGGAEQTTDRCVVVGRCVTRVRMLHAACKQQWKRCSGTPWDTPACVSTRCALEWSCMSVMRHGSPYHGTRHVAHDDLAALSAMEVCVL